MATTYKFLIKAQNVCVLDQKLYAYRIRTDGIMNCTFNKRKLDCIWVAENLYNDICKYDYSLLRSAACAAFRINRLVYPQIPNDQIIYREAVWNEIEKYRKLVYADKEAKLYERILALTSCLGDNFLEWAVVVFNKIRKLYYKIKLKT